MNQQTWPPRFTDVHKNATFLPATVGALIGVHFAILTRFGRANLWRVPRKPLHVVITGGTRGLGKALAREFVQNGDRYVGQRSSCRGYRGVG